MRVLLLLLLLCCLFAPPLLARDVNVSRFVSGATANDVETVRAAEAATWVDADAIRKQSQPSWWRLRLTPGPDQAAVWILAIKETYDAELVVYLPPDYRAQRLYTFDPLRPQIGSRHRLTLELPHAVADAPVFLQLLEGRHQPMRVSAAPLQDYIAEDLTRVRYTSMILSALLLLGMVATTYAVALRRWMLLLFAGWVASGAIYVLVTSGEVVWLVNDPALLRHSMRVFGVSIHIGAVAAYGFVIGFLDMPTHYPRIARMMAAILAVAALLVVLTLVDPRSFIANQSVNLAVVALAILSLGVAVVRAYAGSPQAWFFLLGWGSVLLVGMVRAVYFLQHQGTPDWLEVLHPGIQVFGAMVLVLATARAARYAEREMHVARTVARTDALTRLPNRAQLDQGLAELLQLAARDQLPLSLMFLDLDHFKLINDRHGHAIGDRCLATVGNILRRHVRASDLIARYGGEEFVLALEGAGHERSVAAAEELRRAVEEEGRAIDGRAIGLTVSIGVADFRTGDSVADLLARADAALYRAKREGRNRVVADFVA